MKQNGVYSKLNENRGEYKLYINKEIDKRYDNLKVL